MTRPSKIKPPNLRRVAKKKAGARKPDKNRQRAIQLDTIGKVAAVLSHESRNLLGALGTCVQVLRRNPQLSADDNELLDIMQSGANRLSEVVAQFAACRRVEPIQLRAVNLHDLIEEILIRLPQDERCSPQITIERRFDPQIKFINADAEGLRRALWELCLNGAQAIGKQGKLEVETHRAGGKILVAVGDSGRGIDRDIAQRIFDPLFTTKTCATGLGLAIVKFIVEEHGGTVEVRSQPGKGTKFTIVLPSEANLRHKPRTQSGITARSSHGS